MRRTLGIKRVGHTGTLDPFASGLLVMLVGRATRLARYVVDLDKEYRGVLRLGAETDSWDRTGAVARASDAWRGISDDTIADVLRELVGQQIQQPPPLSAKKLGGVPAHRRVRRGERVELAPTSVSVESLELLRREDDLVTFRALVGSGTYIRWLAHEVGQRLGCGAHLDELRRETVGTFRVEDAVPPEQISPDHVMAAAVAVSHLQTIQAGGDEVAALLHGRTIPRPDTVDSGNVAVLADDRLVAVATCTGDRLKPEVVLS